MTQTAPGTFWGYRRTDGTVGIRNHLVVIPSVVCANTVAQRVAALLPGAIAIPHPHGCAQVGDDVGLTERVLAGAAANPNVGAALIIGLGCETCQATDVAALAQSLAPGRPMQSFYIQDAGGSIKAIAQGVEAGKELLAQVAAQEREPVPLAEVMLATNCGNVNSTTLTATNPTVGVVSDLLVQAGGSVMLGETPELIGASESLMRRVHDRDAADRLNQFIGRARHAPALGGVDGFSAEQVSLACIHKAGTADIQDVVRFAELPQGRGLFVMDTPAHDSVAMSAMAAGGAQLCVFSTGRGTPIGNAIMPVIKVCGNVETNALMADNIDFSTAPPTGGIDSTAALGSDLFALVLAVCNGQLTASEIIGHQEFAIHRIGPTV